MQSSNLFEVHFLLLIFLIQSVRISEAASPSVALSEADWLKRREDFYQSTTFDNSAKIGEHSESHYQAKVHLPFWFDFELYKTLFNKNYPNQAEELARHDVFIRACVRKLRNRYLKRSFSKEESNLDRIDENDDKFYEEKVFMTTTTTTASSTESISEAETTGTTALSGTTQAIADTGTESFIVEIRAEGEAGVEKPLEKAIRLVKLQLESIEDDQQLKDYLAALSEDEKRCVKVKKEKWPYLRDNRNREGGNIQS